MKRAIIGGKTENLIELYSYVDHHVTGSIAPRRFWTTYKTNKSVDAKRMTGSPNDLFFRITIYISNDILDEHFLDAGTKWGPKGFGAALEYRNKRSIDNRFYLVESIL